MKYTVREEGTYINIIRKNEDGSITIIPNSESNSDYQEYLKYLEDNK
jgi:hypothetical protein